MNKTVDNEGVSVFTRLRKNLARLEKAKQAQSQALHNLVKLVDIQSDTTELVHLMNKLGLIKTNNYTRTKLFDTSSLIRMNKALKNNSQSMENNFSSGVLLQQLN